MRNEPRNPLVTDDLHWSLLARYVAGTATPEAAASVRQWIGTDLARKQQVDLLQRIWAKSAEPLIPPEPGNVDRVWRTIEEWIAQGDGAPRPAVRMVPAVSPIPRGDVPFAALHRPPVSRAWWAAAAVAVIAVGAVTGWSAKALRHSVHRAPSMLTYATGNGERATITLPDGGTVALNVASRLEVPMDYMAGDRTVRLMGEALFTVPHRAGAPFSVTAGAATARVLGTSFIVRHYASDTSSLIAVRDGKVAVGPVVLTANRLAEVGSAGALHPGAADPSLFSFATGVLTLNGLPLSQAVVELNRWYDADIRLGDSTLAKQYVKGKFAAGSLGDLAEILELAFDVRVVRDGRVLTLYPRR